VEQTIQINPVELATQLAASRIDELYQSNEIPFPYVDDNEDTDVTCYTEEGQKHFDDWYDWYYTVVTGHSLEAKIDKDTRTKYEDIEWDNTDDNYTDYLEDLIGEHNEDDVTRVSTIDYYFNWHNSCHEYKSILKHKDKYILKRESIAAEFALSGNWFGEEYCYITIKSPLNL